MKLGIIVVFLVLCFNFSQALNKSETLSHFQNLKKELINRSQNTSNQLQEILVDTAHIKLTSDDIDLSAKELLQQTEKVESLRKLRSELDLEKDFLDRIIFRIETKYSDGDMRLFLSRELLVMAQAEALTGSGKMWLFMTYAGTALRDLPEPGDHILSFISGYMEFSTISEPKTPHLYLESRNYSNAVTSVKAQPLSQEQAGMILDQKISQGIIKDTTVEDQITAN